MMMNERVDGMSSAARHVRTMYVLGTVRMLRAQRDFLLRPKYFRLEVAVGAFLLHAPFVQIYFWLLSQMSEYARKLEASRRIQRLLITTHRGSKA